MWFAPRPALSQRLEFFFLTSSDTHGSPGTHITIHNCS